MMRCDTCSNGDRRLAHRPYVEHKRGRIAVITDVPVEECPSCGDVWFEEGVALRLDQMLTEMLRTELIAVRPFDETTPASAA